MANLGLGIVDFLRAHQPVACAHQDRLSREADRSVCCRVLRHRRKLDGNAATGTELDEVDPLIDGVIIVLPCTERHGRDAMAHHPIRVETAFATRTLGVWPCAVTAATARRTTGAVSFMRNGR